MRKYSRVVRGDLNADSVARDCIHDCQWFECEPLPDSDDYEFTVLAEDKDSLDKSVDWCI